MFAWARFDPAAALARAFTWPERSRRTAAGSAIYAWGFRDPEAAQQALDTLPDERLRDFLRGRMVAGWVRGQHRQSANAYIASLPEGPQRSSLVGMLARELNREGPDAVIRWADEVPDLVPGYKRVVFLKACAALAAGDPQRAIQWASTHAGRDYASGAESIIAGRWALGDPVAAIDWLLGLPPGSDRDVAIYDVFRGWFVRDRREAEPWLRAATPAPELDPALRAAVRRTHQDDPAVAMEWAKRISKPGLRRSVIVSLGRNWLKQDSRAAQAWLAGSDLPADVLASIRVPDSPGSEPRDAADPLLDEAQGADPATP
jgi:hypothetical protein